MKNGFTLIELIVTIVIMALIGIVITTNMVGLFSEEEDKEYERFVQKLEEAACIYVETSWDDTKNDDCRASGNCTITVQELISKGYIDDKTKDPSTGEIVNSSKKIAVKWVSNVKTCKFEG